MSVLAYEMKRAGHTQTSLAEVVGPSQSQLSKLFRSQRIINFDELVELCDVLNLRVEWVIEQAEALSVPARRLQAVADSNRDADAEGEAQQEEP